MCLSHFFCFNWRKQRSHVVPSIKRLKCRVSLSDRSCSDALLVWAPLNQRLVVISAHWHQVGSIESCTLIRGVTSSLCFVICASHFIQSSLGVQTLSCDHVHVGGSPHMYVVYWFFYGINERIIFLIVSFSLIRDEVIPQRPLLLFAHCSSLILLLALCWYKWEKGRAMRTTRR